MFHYVWPKLFIVTLFLSTPSCLLSNARWENLSMKEITSLLEKGVSKSDLSDLSRRHLSFEITANHCDLIQDYVDFVSAIAGKIPEEYQRPIVDLKVYFGPKHLVSDKKTFGILGGMGPLSDANIIDLIVNQMISSGIKTTQMSMIHLLSIPPPRTTMDQISGGPAYAMSLASFLRNDYASFFLASNTAHTHLDSLRLIAGSDRIVNLPMAVTKKIVNSPEISNESILILGTTKSWENNLYEDILTQEGVAYKRLKAQDQARIQEWIDRIKTSQIQKHQAHILYQEIRMLGRKYGTANMLLGCTELPIGLAAYASTLYREGYLIFDTEKIFAEVIASAINENKKTP